MNHIYKTLAVFAIILAVGLAGCSTETESDEHEGSANITENQGEHGAEGGEEAREGSGEGREGREGDEHARDEGGEHGGEGGEGHDEEGEESGTEYGLDDIYDNVRNGARLIIAYNAFNNTFIGTVENTTEETLKNVRVEVHLSNGKELGPTTPTDLAPGEIIEVKLEAESKDFDGWSAHPEVG